MESKKGTDIHQHKLREKTCIEIAAEKEERRKQVCQCLLRDKTMLGDGENTTQRKKDNIQAST